MCRVRLAAGLLLTELAAAAIGCVPTRLYSGPIRPRDAVVTVRASGIHRLVKVDRERVEGRAFELEPGRHRLEFQSRSRQFVSGTSFPLLSADCSVELEMAAGHVYAIEGEISKTSPEVPVHDGLTWEFQTLEARFVDQTSDREIDGLSCPDPCRAVGGAGPNRSWMRCDEYQRAVSSPAP